MLPFTCTPPVEANIEGVSRIHSSWSSESDLTTGFRIDLPTRSGHIEDDGWCWGRSGQNGAVRSPATNER